jgi:anti-sigma factor RsiW/anti-anti-sigma regulatory factor
MMPTPFSEELLSAYLDGELTPHERAEVERRLEESPSLREHLDELAEVSRQVRSLPRPEAPSELHVQVSARIHNGTPPRPDPSLRADLSAGSPSRRSPATWRWTVTTACLLLVVAVVQIRRDGPADRLAMPGSGVHEGITHAEISETELALLGLPVSVNGVTYAPQGGTDETAPPLVQVVSLNKNQIQEKLQQLGRLPREGNTLAYLDQSGEAPLLIEFTVVDVMETMGQVQVLLRNQQAVEADSGEPVVTSLDGEVDRKYTAVYLELEENQMAGLLQEVTALGAVAYVDPEVAQEAARDYDHLARLVESRQRRQRPESASGRAAPVLSPSGQSDADAETDDALRFDRSRATRPRSDRNQADSSGPASQRFQQKMNLEPLVRNTAAIDRRSQRLEQSDLDTNFRAGSGAEPSVVGDRPTSPAEPSDEVAERPTSDAPRKPDPERPLPEMRSRLLAEPESGEQQRFSAGMPLVRSSARQTVRAVLIFKQPPADVPSRAPSR